MDWDIELAKMFKERENIGKIGNAIGIVVSTSPLSVTILDGAVMLGRGNLYCCSSLLSYTVNCKIDGYPRTIEFEGRLRVGDKVLVSPDEKEQTWFVIDKINKVG